MRACDRRWRHRPSPMQQHRTWWPFGSFEWRSEKHISIWWYICNAVYHPIHLSIRICCNQASSCAYTLFKRNWHILSLSTLSPYLHTHAIAPCPIISSLRELSTSAQNLTLRPVLSFLVSALLRLSSRTVSIRLGWVFWVYSMSSFREVRQTDSKRRMAGIWLLSKRKPNSLLPWATFDLSRDRPSVWCTRRELCVLFGVGRYRRYSPLGDSGQEGRGSRGSRW